MKKRHSHEIIYVTFKKYFGLKYISLLGGVLNDYDQIKFDNIEGMAYIIIFNSTIITIDNSTKNIKCKCI